MIRLLKLRTVADAVSTIEHGMTIAIGGRANRRMPMALIREIAAQAKTRLRVARLDHAMNLDALAKADNGFIDDDEHLLRARLHAAAMGLAFMPLASSVEVARGHATRTIDDPFDGGAIHIAAALRPDVAVIHAHMADRFGTVVMDAGHDADIAFDATLARASKQVIVSVEQIVSEETVLQNAGHTLLRADEVTCVVQAPYGAHPAACDGRYDHDAGHLEGDAADHNAYLQQIGARRLFSLTRRLSTRL